MLPPSAKILRRLLRRQQETEHIGVEMAMEFRFGQRFERKQFVDAGVVDQHVKTPERLLRFVEDRFTSAALATSPCTAIGVAALG